MLPRLYPQMLEIAWRHQDEGRPVFIVTAADAGARPRCSPTCWASTAGMGTPLEEDADGRYTGKLAGPFAYREGKPMVMRDAGRARRGST